MADEFLRILRTSKQTPLKVVSDRGKELYNSVFQILLNQNDAHLYSVFTQKGLPRAERVIRTISSLLKKPIFDKRIAPWITEIPSIINKYISTIHSLTKKTPIEVPQKLMQKSIFRPSRQKKRKHDPEIKLGQLVRNADIRSFYYILEILQIRSFQ